MDLEEHILFRESDRDSEAPKLSLELSHLKDDDRELTTLPKGLAAFGILFTIRFEGQPDETKSIVIEWESADAMRFSGFVLLHKTKDGLRKCDVRGTQLGKNRDRLRDTEIAPGKADARKHMLSYEYHKAMKSCESYLFFWPGGEVRWWDWGTCKDHEDRTCRTKDIENQARPRLILPASNALEFTGSVDVEPCIERPLFELAPFNVANQRETLWRRCKDRYARIPSPQCLTEADRVPGAPIIKKSIQGQSKLHKYDSYKTTEIISYVIPEGQDGEDLRPITFLDCGITDGMDRYCQSLYSVLPLSAKGSEALRLGDINWGFPLNGYEPDDGTDIPSDDKVGEFSPASHRACHTLYPGQSISFTDYMYPFEWLEERLRVGESYVYRFNGKRIRWWNWGIKEDHKDTMTRQKDMKKSGRPELIVPAVSFDFQVIL